MADDIFDLLRPMVGLSLDKDASSNAEGLLKASCTIADIEKAYLVCQEERRRPLPRSQNAYKLVLHTVTMRLLIAIQ